MGFSEVSARFCGNRKILSSPLSEKDHRTLVHKLLSELLFPDEMKPGRVFVAMFALKKTHPLALYVKAETLSSHHPTKFLVCRAVLAQVGGAALGFELKLPALDSWVSFLSRSLLDV